MGKAGAFFSGMKNGMVTMLNASGSALVSMYDTGAFVVTRTRTVVLPTEKTRLERRIKEYKSRILALQYEIGKESTRFTDPAETVEALELRANVARVKDCEREIEQMNQRLIEIEETKAAAKAAKKAKKMKKKAAAPVAEHEETFDRSAITEALLVIPLETEAIVTHEEIASSEQNGDAVNLDLPVADQADTDSCPHNTCEK